MRQCVAEIEGLADSPSGRRRLDSRRVKVVRVPPLSADASHRLRYRTLYYCQSSQRLPIRTAHASNRDTALPCYQPTNPLAGLRVLEETHL